MVQNEASKRTSLSRKTQNRSQSIEKQIMGVPARIMAPRLILIAITAALVCFGFVMIFSASSVKAISESGNPTAYLSRQVFTAAIGLAAAVVIARADYHVFTKRLGFFWALMIASLVAVYFLGDETNGASRWISIFGVRVQPSEFAKIVICVSMAYIADQFYGKRSMSLGQAALYTVGLVGVPLGLILIQPDKGTTGVIVIMVLAILVSAGFPGDYMVKIVGFCVTIALIIALADDYSRQRILTMINPASDPYDTGYQLNQGFIAFGSGGLFGVGIGMSRQKYSYLPEAHNDFIFAIIGEELGLVGTLLVLAAFFFLAYEAWKIADNAPDLQGRLIVMGCITLIITQFFLNVTGVLGLFPLSGKPLPFLSYGGSSIIVSIMLIGLIVSVSKQSALPETEHDRRRQAMSLAGDEDTGVGEPVARSAASRGESLSLGSIADYPAPSRSGSGSPRSGSGLRVLDGGNSNLSKRNSSGPYERTDLGPSASERLRPRSNSKTSGSRRGGRTNKRS